MWAEALSVTAIILAAVICIIVIYQSQMQKLDMKRKLRNLVEKINEAQYNEYLYDTKQDEVIRNVDTNVSQINDKVSTLQKNLQLIEENMLANPRNTLKISDSYSAHTSKAEENAEISNDTKSYKELMIMGNRTEDGSTRKVGVWDDLHIHGSGSVDGELSAKSLFGQDAVAVGDACYMNKNGITKTDILQLGDKFRLSGVGEGYRNDSWLRLYKADGTGYYGGLAAKQLWSEGGIVSGSDARMKKNITDITADDISKLDQLTARKYIYKNDSDNKERFGFIAQEVQKVYPNLVETGANGMMSLRYSDIIPLLVAKIQDLENKLHTSRK